MKLKTSRKSSPAEVLHSCSNWLQFDERLYNLPNTKQQGDCFEELVRLYLSIHPTYLSQLADVWHLRDVPSDVRMSLNLPDRDEGIDLVARTKDGNFWAIQCKYRTDPTHSLTRRELATFTDLAFGICRGFELALVCSTTERFSHKLSLHGERLTFLAGDIWRSLDTSFFDLIRCFAAKRKTAITPASPRPHQVRAISEAINHFETEGNSRGKLIMPCGTGKSLTGWWLAEKLLARTVLIAVPSLSLVKQTLEVWARESVANQRDIRWTAVCSDESVARDDRDDVAVLVQDLGVRVHTDPHEIAGWLSKPHDGITVVFTTYQSGRAIAKAAMLASFNFDLGIFDEAHKTVGKKGSLFDLLVHDKNIPIARRVFMTATERRYRGDSDGILSMDDPNTYGETFHMLSFKNALECDPPILSDYRIVTVAVTRQEIASLVQANVLVHPDRGVWDEELEAEMLAGLIALRKAMQRYPIRHAVSFHANIARAKAFRDSQDAFTGAFPEYGKLETFHVTGATPTAVRKRVLDSFAASERSLITNARCLTEGVDVPSIDCVLFADPKRSTVDIVQAVGRALRPVQGKQLGFVVVPVLVSEGKPEDTPFDNVLMVLRALAANDERIVEYFRNVSQGKQWSGNTPIEFTVPSGVEVNTDEFVQAIELQAWSRLAKLSWRPFEEARDFARGLGIEKQKEWFKLLGRTANILPADIPASPQCTYRNNGWISWGDWLGTGAISNQLRGFRNFEEARAFVHTLKLKKKDEWVSYVKGQLPDLGELPNDIPAAPQGAYFKKGWKGYGDWLGTGNVASFLREYRDFNSAREFVRSLYLKGSAEWLLYKKGELPEKGMLPADIPAAPDQAYKDKGWQNWGDWLGTGTVATQLRLYREFADAREFVQSLGLKSRREWDAYKNGLIPNKPALPNDIPANPSSVYKDKGWKGMGDWIGTRTIKPGLRCYMEFEDARDFARSLCLKSSTEWRDYTNGNIPDKGVLPNNIPADPRRVYKNKGWKSMGDWLGTGTIAPMLRQYRSFEAAREFVHGLSLRSQSEWFLFAQGKFTEKGLLPQDIPASPYLTYKNKGWKGFGDWLGTGNIASFLREYRDFSLAREFARSLGLKSSSEWKAYTKGQVPDKVAMPDDIPAYPAQTYKDKGWKGYGDWLGTGVIASQYRQYRDFTLARDFVRSLCLKSRAEWQAYSKGKMPDKGFLPNDIPACPEKTYRTKGWKGMGDWLGTGTIAPMLRQYRSFDAAREFVHGLGLKSLKEWISYTQGLLNNKDILPDDIPAYPNQTYKDKGWKGYGDWLGTGTIAPNLRQYRPFEVAREFARSLNLNSQAEWQAYTKGLISDKVVLPDDIPVDPRNVYKNKGWQGMRDWLGTNEES